MKAWEQGMVLKPSHSTTLPILDKSSMFFGGTKMILLALIKMPWTSNEMRPYCKDNFSRETL